MKRNTMTMECALEVFKDYDFKGESLVKQLMMISSADATIFQTLNGCVEPIDIHISDFELYEKQNYDNYTEHLKNKIKKCYDNIRREQNAIKRYSKILLNRE
jgi:hypothetical protein